jgi:branched-chain amino acid transport system ATP-binding protein
MLEVKSLSIHFGGIHAVRDVSFSLTRGHVMAIIGPNGAGKTTLFNMISGIYRPTDGDVLLNGESIRGMAVHKIAHRGMSRTFQNLQVFSEMTALENVMVGSHMHLPSHPFTALLRTPNLRRSEEHAMENACALLKLVGLEGSAHLLASAMSYGALKRLEIARALAAKPTLLLLDEPAAGLNPSEKVELRDLIQAISKKGVTVLLVEHDMKLVMGVADRIVVLHHGEKLSEGSPSQVSSDPAVISAYLGGEAA